MLSLGLRFRKRIAIEIQDTPLSNKPRSVESPKRVKYCKHMLEHNQE